VRKSKGSLFKAALVIKNPDIAKNAPTAKESNSCSLPK